MKWAVESGVLQWLRKAAVVVVAALCWAVPVTANATWGASALTVTAAQNPTSVGASVSFQVAVSLSGKWAGPDPTSIPTPTGTVTLVDNYDSSATCTVSLSNGSGSCALTFASADTYTITATYSGDGNYAASSTTVSETVDMPTITTLSVPAQIDVGASVTVSADVSPVLVDDNWLGGLSGTVVISDNIDPGATCTVTVSIYGFGTCTVTFATAGAHTLTGKYSGASSEGIVTSFNYLASTGTTSITVNSPHAANSRCYVNASAAGVNSGSSWTDAYIDLQFALIDTGCSEIWVAEGFYKPTRTSDQTIAFSIRPHVAVYGGFAGTETTRDARDPAANITVLSGDLKGNDPAAYGIDLTVPTDGSNADNSYHVVIMDGTTSAGIIGADTVLDGVTITAGFGRALFCNGSGSGSECSPSLNNVIFSGNYATHGAAMYNDGAGQGVSKPTLRNVAFRGNSATYGGAMFNNGNSNGTSSPILIDVTFSNNSATLGGAMLNDGTAGGISSPTLTDVLFESNSASSDGGAIYNDGNSGVSNPTLTNVTFNANAAIDSGGAMYNDGSNGGVSSPVLNNVTFSSNTAKSGGAMSNGGSGGVSSPILTYVTFSRNTATNYGGAMYNDGSATGKSTPILTDVILANDTVLTGADYGAEIYNNLGDINQGVASATLHYSLIWGSDSTCPDAGAANTCDSSVIYVDPQLGTLSNNGGFTQTLLPGTGSKAIDAGVCAGDAGAPASITIPTTDQRGVTRPQGPHCDIGAVEVLVLTGPTTTMAFSPVNVNIGGTYTLTVTLSNPNSTALRLDTADVTITGLPGGGSVSVPSSNPAIPNSTALRLDTAHLINTGLPGGASVSVLSSNPTIACSDGTGANDPPIVIPAQSGGTPGTCTLTFVNIPVGTTTGSYTATWPANVKFVAAMDSTASVSTTTPSTSTTPLTVTVTSSLTAPTIALAFNPSSVNVGGTSALTAILSNPNSVALQLNSAVTIMGLPGGATLDAAHANSIACSDGTGANDPPTVIPANGGTCTLTFANISAGTMAGSFPATWPSGVQFSTTNGQTNLNLTINTTTSSTATLTVISSGGPGANGGALVPAPTLSNWTLALLGLLLACIGLGFHQRARTNPLGCKGK